MGEPYRHSKNLNATYPWWAQCRRRQARAWHSYYMPAESLVQAPFGVAVASQGVTL